MKCKYEEERCEQMKVTYMFGIVSISTWMTAPCNPWQTTIMVVASPDTSVKEYSSELMHCISRQHESSETQTSQNLCYTCSLWKSRWNASLCTQS